MNDEFQSVEELYQRVRPALRTKVRKLSKRGIQFVTEDDIWILLMEKWKSAEGLTLFDVVHDIMHLDEDIFLEDHKNNTDSNNRE